MKKMNSFQKSLFCFLTITLVLFSCNKTPKLPVWEISKENTPTSYLIGTINYLKKETTSDILDQNVLSYLRNSDVFICQIDIKNSDYFITKSHLEIENKKYLKDILPKENFEQLKQFQSKWMKDNKNPITNPDSCRMKLLFYLEDILFSKNNLYFNFDSYWRRQAMTKNIDIIGLETYQEYYSDLSKISMEEQIKFMNSIQNPSLFMNQLSNNIDSLYKNQKYLKIQKKLLNKFNYLSSNYDQFFTQKHKLWTNKIDNILKSKKCFVSFDIMHLYGENNLIDILLSKGYKIKKIQ